MMKHTHSTFLSDPDWPEHSLQVFWGASTFLAPDVCLHWSYSQWLGQHPHQQFRPDDPALRPYQFDFYTRIAMLHGFGFSQMLPQLPDWMQDRLSDHIRVYQSVVRPFIRDADLYRLTAQPQREGGGDRWAAFQYRMPRGGDHLLFVFRLSGAEPQRRIRLQGLVPGERYRLMWMSGNEVRVVQGSDLLGEGLLFAQLAEEESAIIRIRLDREN